MMDEKRKQAITTVRGVRTCYYNGWAERTHNGWGERASYYNDEEREQAIIMDEEREQAIIMDEERDHHIIMDRGVRKSY